MMASNFIIMMKVRAMLFFFYMEVVLEHLDIQILKITFSLNFIAKNKTGIIIWDADTIILKKINFFKKGLSIKYGNFFEFHKAYYLTNKEILKDTPNYFISFLNQFIIDCYFSPSSACTMGFWCINLVPRISES